MCLFVLCNTGIGVLHCEEGMGPVSMEVGDGLKNAFGAVVLACKNRLPQEVRVRVFKRFLVTERKG